MISYTRLVVCCCLLWKRQIRFFFMAYICPVDFGLLYQHSFRSGYWHQLSFLYRPSPPTTTFLTYANTNLRKGALLVYYTRFRWYLGYPTLPATAILCKAWLVDRRKKERITSGHPELRSELTVFTTLQLNFYSLYMILTWRLQDSLVSLTFSFSLSLFLSRAKTGPVLAPNSIFWINCSWLVQRISLFLSPSLSISRYIYSTSSSPSCSKLPLLRV